jgi:hypothetical protein
MDEWFPHLDASDYMLRIIDRTCQEKEKVFMCIEFSYFHLLLLENGFTSVSYYISFRKFYFCVSDLLSAGIDRQGWKRCKF